MGSRASAAPGIDMPFGRQLRGTPSSGQPDFRRRPDLEELIELLTGECTGIQQDQSGHVSSTPAVRNRWLVESRNDSFAVDVLLR